MATGSALCTTASLSPEDGRIHLSLLKNKLSLPKLPTNRTSSLPEYGVDPQGQVPPLNIVIFVVGSRGRWGGVSDFSARVRAPSRRSGLVTRALTSSFYDDTGDVQPFIPLAHGLQKKGHRVRLGTHSTFEKFVREQGIEFFDIGGDPAELMSYMVSCYSSVCKGRDVADLGDEDRLRIRGCCLVSTRSGRGISRRRGR